MEDKSIKDNYFDIIHHFKRKKKSISLICTILESYFTFFVKWTGYNAIWRAYLVSLHKLINWSDESGLWLLMHYDKCVQRKELYKGLLWRLLVFKHSEAQDNAHLRSHFMSQQFPKNNQQHCSVMCLLVLQSVCYPNKG